GGGDTPGPRRRAPRPSAGPSSRGAGRPTARGGRSPLPRRPGPRSRRPRGPGRPGSGRSPRSPRPSGPAPSGPPPPPRAPPGPGSSPSPRSARTRHPLPPRRVGRLATDQGERVGQALAGQDLRFPPAHRGGRLVASVVVAAEVQQAVDQVERQLRQRVGARL